MLGLTVEQSVGVCAGAYLVVRAVAVLGGAALRGVADRDPPRGMVPPFVLLTGIVVAAALVAHASAAVEAPGVARLIAQAVAGVGGFVVGMMFDIVLTLRAWRVWRAVAARRVPAHRAALKNESAAVRRRAAERLGQLGDGARPALPELRAALTDADAGVRAEACGAIANAIPMPSADDTETVPAVRPLLTDPDLRVRVCACAVLLRFAAVPVDDAVPHLAAGLNEPDGPTHWAAALATQELGPRAEPLLPALRAAALEREPGSPWAVEALGAVGAPAVPALIEVARRAPTALKRAAARELGIIGPSARAAVPVLRELEKHPDGPLQSAARAALRAIGSN
jgi:hypothetical protein